MPSARTRFALASAIVACGEGGGGRTPASDAPAYAARPDAPPPDAAVPCVPGPGFEVAITGACDVMRRTDPETGAPECVASGTVASAADSGFTIDAGGAAVTVAVAVPGHAIALPAVGAAVELATCQACDGGPGHARVTVDGALWLALFGCAAAPARGACASEFTPSWADSGCRYTGDPDCRLRPGAIAFVAPDRSITRVRAGESATAAGFVLATSADLVQQSCGAATSPRSGSALAVRAP